MSCKIKAVGLIALLFVGMMLTIPSNVKGQEGAIPVAKLEIPDNLKSVDVDPASDGTAVFSGTLTVACKYPTVTEFKTSCSQPWVVTVSPASIGLQAGTITVNVTIVVKVPQKTDADAAGTVEIEGRTRTATPVSYSTRFGNEVFVSVNKYYVFSVSSPAPYLEVSPHTQTTIMVNIENMGNAIANDLHITVENKKQLIADGWIITEPPTKLQISGEQNRTVFIKVETPRDWTLWTDTPQEIVVKVSSSTAGVSETYSTYIRQKGTYIPGFEPAIMLIALGLIAVMIKKKH